MAEEALPYWKKYETAEFVGDNKVMRFTLLNGNLSLSLQYNKYFSVTTAAARQSWKEDTDIGPLLTWSPNVVAQVCCTAVLMSVFIGMPELIKLVRKPVRMTSEKHRSLCAGLPWEYLCSDCAGVYRLLRRS